MRSGRGLKGSPAPSPGWWQVVCFPQGPARLHPDLHLTWHVLSRETPTSPLSTDPALNGKGWSGDGQWRQRHIKGFWSGSQGAGAAAQEGPPQLGEQWAGVFPRHWSPNRFGPSS